MERNLGLRIALGIVGLGGLAFSLLTGYAHGFALDVVNFVTIGASVLALVSAMFMKSSESKGKGVQPHHL